MTGQITFEQVEAVRPLLAFIYSGEGSYTSVNRGRAGDTPNGDPALVNLSLGQVKAAQAKGTYFAVGAAQFIPETLKLAQADAEISDETIFAPAIQDRLAAALLLGSKRPILAAFLRGQRGQAKASIDDAQTDLAYEWASIPLPNGRGAYDGDGAGNNANQDVTKVREALLQAQKAIFDLNNKGTGLNTTVTTPAPILTISALQDTWLKKKAIPANELRAKEKTAVNRGQVVGVLAVRELPRTAHVEVDLAEGGGTWVIWQPHWHGFSAPPTSPIVSGLIDWSDFGAAVSPHLTVGEVLQFDLRRRPSAGSGDIPRIIYTARRGFEPLRNAWGTPLGISSFYRPEPINAEVGGVSNSQHIPGNAFDCYPIDRSLEEFYQWARVRWTGGLGDGRNKGFLHFDNRNGGGFVPGGGRRPAAEWVY